MAELERRQHGNLFARRALFGIGDRDEGKNRKRYREDGERNVHHEVDIGDFGRIGNLADEGENQHWSRSASQGVERRTDHVQLVAAVSAAAQEVEHRVDDHVQHADREAAHESAGKIDDEREDSVTVGRYRNFAGKELY